MDIAIKKIHSFRLSVELIERLKQLAKSNNRSLNNYVETVLLDVAYNKLNILTLEAMREAESGALRDVESIDLSSIESVEKSMNL